MGIEAPELAITGYENGAYVRGDVDQAAHTWAFVVERGAPQYPPD